MKKLFTGNEAAARGAWEAGVKFASAYPGTPSTEILENLALYDEVQTEWAPNEKVAVEAVAGASIAGIRTLACMKHVGMNVAADPMFTFAYLGVNGGSVILTADEPGMFSSQNEQDNRRYARHAKLAMFEPSDSQETKDMMKDAYDVSETFDIPVLFRMTTRVDHSKSIVECSDRTEIADKPYEKNIQKYCPLPAFTPGMQQKLAQNFERLKTFTNECKWNYYEDNHKDIGIVASGVSYCYAKEVFGDQASYCKIGFSYPMPMDMIKAFASKVKTIYVLEENDPIMETEIKAAGIDCIGKDLFPQMGELLPEKIRKAAFGRSQEVLAPNEKTVVGRPPALCAGCPHRGFFYELGKLKNTMIFGDIGCYTLGLSAPYNATDALVCMGASISGGHGVAQAFKIKGEDKKVVSVIGDSTFFHSGITSLMDAAYNRSSYLTVILDNRITGMTGHQENPGSGYDLKGNAAPIIDIEAVCRALNIENIRTIDPNNLEETKAALEWGITCEGPAVIITRWPCALKRLSMEDKEEFPQVFTEKYEVLMDKCIGCKKCIGTGCPALEFGRVKDKKMTITSACVGCSVCGQVCPVDAIVKKA
ncbi:indolepyruvate ferredoxin oxidoreductase subunit alpha [Pseudoramibacter faecis]|uniref:indolepyruvate ferredoxin oxidoreductase subunit alpha n=1 Tax=Pseudoramibacter faecis TaxID=3108534 RepID=UPI002E7A43FF|nr:indolepyruvate ferredoxin oxidoreductase subunit alpha [Pseudoramibacter sp. HA2172]